MQREKLAESISKLQEALQNLRFAWGQPWSMWGIKSCPTPRSEQFHCLSAGMFSVQLQAGSLRCGTRNRELLGRQGGYLEISTHKTGAIISRLEKVCSLMFVKLFEVLAGSPFNRAKR